MPTSKKRLGPAIERIPHMVGKPLLEEIFGVKKKKDVEEFSIKLVTLRNGKACWEESVVMPSSTELKTSQRACHHMLVAKVIDTYVALARPNIYEGIETVCHIEMNGLTYKFQMKKLRG